MTIGNVNDAPIKLNALMVDNLRASSDDLASRIALHYREQAMYQVHRVLGSIDILGNPVGLFSNLSSGFGELFYEPYQGFIMSDRPQDLGIGVAKVNICQKGLVDWVVMNCLYIGCWWLYEKECFRCNR